MSNVNTWGELTSHCRAHSLRWPACWMEPRHSGVQR